MALVRVLHWKAVEAEPLLHILMRAGHTVDYEEQFRPESLREWRKSPPDLFVIDLSRLPSHGKEIAIALRQSPATRCRPIVFCGGEERKVQALRALLPDAGYCDLRGLKHFVNAALRTKPVNGAATPPVSMMNRYGSRTTPQKLGIRPGAKLFLVEPPPHIESVLGDLPPDVEFVEGDAEVTLCFLHDPDSVRQAFSDLRSHAAGTKLWMLWRKKGSSGHAGISGDLVRETGVSVGLVDYKICSVDADWSAMLFARRRS